MQIYIAVCVTASIISYLVWLWEPSTKPPTRCRNVFALHLIILSQRCLISVPTHLGILLSIPRFIGNLAAYRCRIELSCPCVSSSLHGDMWRLRDQQKDVWHAQHTPTTLKVPRFSVGPVRHFLCFFLSILSFFIPSRVLFIFLSLWQFLIYRLCSENYKWKQFHGLKWLLWFCNDFMSLINGSIPLQIKQCPIGILS